MKKALEKAKKNFENERQSDIMNEMSHILTTNRYRRNEHRFEYIPGKAADILATVRQVRIGVGCFWCVHFL